MKERNYDETWRTLIETQQYRDQNISMFDPEYELLVEDYLEELDEQGV